MSSESARCRGCGLELNGKPFYAGGVASHPRTGEICKKNHYGGFVCSWECDNKSSRELENSMPGSTPGGNRSLSGYAKASIRENWGY